MSEYAECVELAQTYLESRGIPIEVAQRHQLGYVLDPIPGHERFNKRLAIPYLTPAGPVNVKYRCIEAHNCKEAGHPKYDTESGSGLFLFGVPAFGVDSPFICVTEGEIDAISASVAGLPAVGVPGAKAWKDHWEYCFEGYEEVIVLRDGDKAGEELGDCVSRRLHTVRVITFEEDVNAFLVGQGPAALRQKVGVDE